MREKSRAQRGFTLIEMMIVIAIVGILSAMTLVSFSGKRSERGIDRASHTLAAALREAQSYAQTGRTTTIVQDNCSYRLQISVTAYVVVNTFRLAGDPPGTCTGVGTVASYRLTDGVVVSSGSVTIGFNIPRGEVTRNGVLLSSSTPSYARIDLATGSLARYVCIYPTGRVVENGSSSTCAP
jgi:prepilin-type N-terminal cleavage/methylation domain-containing protein